MQSSKTVLIQLRKIVSHSLPLTPVAVVNRLSSNLDFLIIKFLFSDESAGLYRYLSSLFMGVKQAQRPIQVIAMKSIGRGGKEKIYLFRISTLIISIFTIIFVWSLLSFTNLSDEFTGEWDWVAPAIVFLSIGSIFIGFNGIEASILNLDSKNMIYLKRITFSLLTSCVVGFSLYLIIGIQVAGIVLAIRSSMLYVLNRKDTIR